MNSWFRVGLAQALFLCSVAISGSVFAANADTTKELLTAEERWAITRLVMSKPGVMLDMANLADNGYVWKNDALWKGDALPANEKWYTAAFFFKRPRYKGVWLQYAFQLDETTGSLNGFKRSYGAATFR